MSDGLELQPPGTGPQPEAGGLGPVRIGGLDPTKVIVVGLLVLADLAVLAALVVLAIWIL